METGKLIVTCIILVMFAIGMAGSIISIGRPRKPVTHGQALAAIIFNLAYMTGIVYIAGGFD